MVVGRWTKVLIAFATGCAYPATITAEPAGGYGGIISCRGEGLGNDECQDLWKPVHLLTDLDYGGLRGVVPPPLPLMNGRTRSGRGGRIPP
jgi:hypothetical protein